MVLVCCRSHNTLGPPPPENGESDKCLALADKKGV